MAGRGEFNHRQRVIVAGIAWFIAAPFLFGMILINAWFGLVVIAIGVYTTWEYVRRGANGEGPKSNSRGTPG